MSVTYTFTCSVFVVVGCIVCSIPLYVVVLQYNISMQHTVLVFLLTLTCRLRSPKAPDEHADMGQHSFAYAVMPHQGMVKVSGGGGGGGGTLKEMS